jgi:hypothetical protein
MPNRYKIILVVPVIFISLLCCYSQFILETQLDAGRNVILSEICH